MYNSKYFTKVLQLLFLSIIVPGCFDKPDEFVAPVWSAEVNIPITTKEFSLSEIVEKDSSLLKSSQDPSTLGLIYFGDTQSVATITVEDELKLDPFETNYSQSIGVIEVNIPIPAASQIRVNDWAKDVTPGSFQVFPEQEGNVVIDVNGVETVESILIEDGKLSILVWNNLPVEIVLRGLKIQNSSNGAVIAEVDDSRPSEWIAIPPMEIDTLTFPISNKIVTNALQYIGTIYSAGSNGDSVQVYDEAGTTILALFENLTIGAATAALPEQNFQIKNSIGISDSTKIENAIISEGRAILNVNNNMDVDLTADVKFNNLFDESGEQFSLIISLLRNEKNRVIEIPSLANWKIVTESPGVPTGEITYSIEITTDSTGEISTIAKDDSLSFNLVFEELVFESFEGILKPTKIDLDDSGFKMDFGDFDDKLEFGSINFKDATFNLNLQSSSDIKLLLNGELTATNGQIQNQKALENIMIPATDPIEIDITDLINGFSTELPDSFAMVGAAILNPYYEVSKVTRGDSVYGSIDFEIPLNVGIANGSFKDTIDIDLGDVDEDDIDRLNYGEVTFTIRNSVPVGLTLTALILDSNYTPVLTIPTERDNLTFVEVPKPDVSESGDILLAGEVEQTISLYGDEIKKLLNNPYMLIQVNFSTAGVGSTPVKFKTSNSISFDVRAKAEYRVDL